VRSGPEAARTILLFISLVIGPLNSLLWYVPFVLPASAQGSGTPAPAGILTAAFVVSVFPISLGALCCPRAWHCLFLGLCTFMTGSCTTVTLAGYDRRALRSGDRALKN